MVSITLSVSQEIKNKMNSFEEMNWSGFIRKCIEQKTTQLTRKEELFALLKEDDNITKWSLPAIQKGRLGRHKKRLKKVKK